jgi:broad specificity phosphatase PhoE
MSFPIQYAARADLAPPAENEVNMNFNDKSKAIVCLIRHGQTNWNVEGRMQGREEVPLNENGIAQAKEAAKGMKAACDAAGIYFNKIISSPLERAVDTAKIISDEIGCDYFGKDERWLERDFGALSGYTYEDYARAIHAGRGPENIEPVEKMMERAYSFFNEMAKPGERILVLTHGAMATTLAKNSKKPAYIPEDKVGGVGNCHASFYTYDGKDITLEGFNIHPDDVIKFVTGNMEE